MNKFLVSRLCAAGMVALSGCVTVVERIDREEPRGIRSASLSPTALVFTTSPIILSSSVLIWEIQNGRPFLIEFFLSGYSRCVIAQVTAEVTISSLYGGITAVREKRIVEVEEVEGDASHMKCTLDGLNLPDTGCPTQSFTKSNGFRQMEKRARSQTSPAESLSGQLSKSALGASHRCAFYSTNCGMQ